MLYKIVLGSHNNKKSEIHIYGGKVTTVDTLPILNCSESQTLWVPWSSGHIGVERGQLPGFRQIADVDDPNFKSISYIVLSISVTARTLDIFQVREIIMSKVLRFMLLSSCI